MCVCVCESDENVGDRMPSPVTFNRVISTWHCAFLQTLAAITTEMRTGNINCVTTTGGTVIAQGWILWMDSGTVVTGRTRRKTRSHRVSLKRVS